MAGSGYPPPRICILFSGRHNISRCPPDAVFLEFAKGGQLTRRTALLPPARAAGSPGPLSLDFARLGTGTFTKPPPVLGRSQCLPELMREDKRGPVCQAKTQGWRRSHSPVALIRFTS